MKYRENFQDSQTAGNLPRPGVPFTCKKFNECDAPLCPLDKASLGNAIWFPGEPFCSLKTATLHAYGVDLSVSMQKRICKAGIAREAGFFTFRMLSRRVRVTQRLRGLNDKTPGKAYDLKAEEAKWISHHMELKPIPPAVLRERQNRFFGKRVREAS